ncbi:hypothetical protein AXK57_03015 [Tsukamurella pulmonis]|uniref:glycerophosphodiester phosphodiesterase family protein n=1 Tax=Tsukamurella pulmonis TaxID=47312 RepID=UPI0007952C20|nr:glycerophosphodiester phosphodiesterase family protein [Tsukamurella pulmonis]KXP13215.1 hypothetical protein AXK57_03015 [Tsukamurella pulmonis]RDH10735.1 hypothetical protein DVB88_16400 [Tsukamurella pulmonis]
MVTPPTGEHSRRLREILARTGTAISAHRGAGRAMIPENTAAAVEAAVREGADIVEVDVVRSSDGEFFLFHTGYEEQRFGSAFDIRDLTGAQVRDLRYRDRRLGGTAVAPTSLAAALATGHLLNLDRSWWYWDTLLPYLDGHADPGDVLLKSPPEPGLLAQLAAHPVHYPFLAIVRDPDEIERVRAVRGINLVGVELVAGRPDHPFVSGGVIDALRRDGLLAAVNTINLEEGEPLLCGWDDETSILGDPDAGWGRALATGAAIVQTDWPGLLARYRDGLRGHAAVGS